MGLGQPVGAVQVDRVLGGDDQEGAGHRIADGVDGDLAFLHDLEQGRLGLRGRPVDLVAEHQVGEDRAPVELEARGFAGPRSTRR